MLADRKKKEITCKSSNESKLGGQSMYIHDLEQKLESDNIG